MILEVVDGGLATTVQDAGRPDWTHVGVPDGGAADPWSLAVANLLAGNDPGAAALEMTIAGPRLIARDDGVIALAGADLGGRVVGGRRLGIGRSHRIASGEELSFDGVGAGHGRAAGGGPGARAYLAVTGGVDVPLVLGSRSTCLAGGFGGLGGRALVTGDRIVSGPTDDPRRPTVDLVWPAEDADEDEAFGTGTTVLRVLPGLVPGLAAIVGGPWRVGAAMDRVGVRLEGRELPSEVGGETLTHGVPWGAVQVPPDGRPIVLGPDHQTTGGYRVPAVVISADLPLLGQLRPGDEVRLVETDTATAARASRARRDGLIAGAAALLEAAGWDRLASSAGA
jgi:antagonist of KipI